LGYATRYIEEWGLGFDRVSEEEERKDGNRDHGVSESHDDVQARMDVRT
jgi:hypothetical protein